MQDMMVTMRARLTPFWWLLRPFWRSTWPLGIGDGVELLLHAAFQHFSYVPQPSLWRPAAVAPRRSDVLAAAHLCCAGHAPAGGVDSGFRFVWEPATGWDVTDEADWFHMDVNSQEETDAKSYLQVH